MARSISPPSFADAIVARRATARRAAAVARRAGAARRGDGCASAATTRRGSWRAGSRAGSASPPSPTLLLRLRETAHQLALPLAERAGNVRGAFAVEPRRRAELRGRHVAVVDDVMTTGSTAAEIAARPQAGGRGDGRGLGAGAHAAPGRRLSDDVEADVQHRSRRARDPAEHRQRDPPGGQHRLPRCTSSSRSASRCPTRCCAAPASTTTSTSTCGGTRRGRPSSRPPAPIRAGCSRSRPTAVAPSPTVAFAAPATGSSSAARSSGLPAAVRDDDRRRADRAPADARRPAQPQPQQRGRGRGLRGLAPERLRRIGLSRASNDSGRASRRISCSSASLGRDACRPARRRRRRRSASRRRSRRARASTIGALRTPSATWPRSARMSASALPRRELDADRAVARQVAGRGEDQVAEARQAHEGLGASAPRATPRRVISARPRVTSAARALRPRPMPSAMPVAIASTFLTAPPTSTPTGSADV